MRQSQVGLRRITDVEEVAAERVGPRAATADKKHVDRPGAGYGKDCLLLFVSCSVPAWCHSQSLCSVSGLACIPQRQNQLVAQVTVKSYNSVPLRLIRASSIYPLAMWLVIE